LARFDGPLAPLPIQHRLPSLKNKKFSCDICKKGVGTKGGMIYHMKAHLFGKPFKCEICSRSYTTKNDFDTHYKRHAGQTFTCDLCARKYKVKQYLADHIAGTHLPKVIPCPHNKCNKLLPNKGMLNKHIYSVHYGVSQNQYLCKLCGTRFGKQAYKTHCAKRELSKYECLVCHEKFTCYKLLVEHRREETKRLSFCKICNIFVGVGYYKMHMYSHHGNFQCDICQFKTNKSALHLSHQKKCGTKEQIRALGHHCVVCDEYFRSKVSLEKHKNRQHGNFKCLKCSKRFHTKITLHNHERYHKKLHQLPLYKCILCPNLRNFNSKKGFDSHFFCNHNTVPAIDGKKIRRFYGYMCDKCRCRVKNMDQLFSHIVQCYKIKQIGRLYTHGKKW